MKSSLLKKAFCVLVVATMLFALLAVGASAADDTKIIVHAVNAYPDYNGIIAWSTTATNNVESIYATYVEGVGAWDGTTHVYFYWTHVYLVETENAGVYEVKGNVGPQVQDYSAWEINENAIVLTSFQDATDVDSRSALLALQVGDLVTLHGDILDKDANSYTLDSAYFTLGASAPESSEPAEESEPAVDESSAVVDESSAVVEESSVEVEESVAPESSAVVEESETGTPDAGDASSMIIIAIIALVAVAGAAVVIRKR